MDTIYERVAGLDVHKTFIMCCARMVDPKGKATHEIRRFGTMTSELLELADWLNARGVTHVAMESTAVLWKPVWNILDTYDFDLLLANAKELKQVPGRKSDVKDSQWIAQLLSCGLLKSSFVPTRAQRNLRDLTRHRARLNGERTRCVNRIHKILQDANIKLSSVASDILGVTGRDILDALVAGQADPEALSKLARGKLRKKIPQLNQALRGLVTEHHRFMLQQLLEHLAMLETQLAQFNQRIVRPLSLLSMSRKWSGFHKFRESAAIPSKTSLQKSEWIWACFLPQDTLHHGLGFVRETKSLPANGNAPRQPAATFGFDAR